MNGYKRILISLFALFTISGLMAQKANIVYVEGKSSVKSAAGSLRKADFGGSIAFGESVITGKDGTVELTLDNGSTIRVTPNSVFGYSNTGSGSDSRQVLATAAGKVSYKLNKATGKPPVIQTNSMVAGVRGTEFTVYAGRDGSVLLAVTEGIVDVDAQGKTVELLKDEAVEVEPGKAPGAKFTWLGKQLDFSDWNRGKSEDFLSDPLGSLKNAEQQLAVSAAALIALQTPYLDATEAWKKATEEYRAILASGDETAIKKFQAERLFPAQDERAVIILNRRFHALNYLSIRRYVVSNMYMEMKSRYPLKRPAEIQEFFDRHAALLARYESDIVPQLNENDY